MTQFVQAPSAGSQPPVPNQLAGGDLHTAILTDPLTIRAYRDTIADQLNQQSAGPRFEDLSERIASVQIETSAQGASILSVGVIDPMWVIPMSGFIQVDDTGYLWPPIDITFPTGTDCTWRLCQVHMIWDAELGQDANLTLTFEDRIASLLREMSPAMPGGISQGQPNQSLGGFIKQLVDNTNQILKLRPEIRLVELISPADPNYTVPITQTPASAQGPLRKNPNKSQAGLSAEQQRQLAQSQQAIGDMFNGPAAQRISEIEAYGLAKIQQRLGTGSDAQSEISVWGAGNAP